MIEGSAVGSRLLFDLGPATAVCAYPSLNSYANHRWRAFLLVAQ